VDQSKGAAEGLLLSFSSLPFDLADPLPADADPSTDLFEGGTTLIVNIGDTAGHDLGDEPKADNDCDAGVDESDPNLDETCNTGLFGVCAAGVNMCAEGVLACEQTVLRGVEDCDDIDTDCDGLSDPPSCTRIVFATSTLQNGNLGGLAGADQICQEHADAAGLLGSFKAWLSDSRPPPAGTGCAGLPPGGPVWSNTVNDGSTYDGSLRL